MSYAIVLNETGVTVKTRAYGKEMYATERAAKAGATRLIKKGKLMSGMFTIYEANSIPERTHMVRNLMTGKMVEESVNTPYTCSVASESFWSN